MFRPHHHSAAAALPVVVLCLLAVFSPTTARGKSRAVAAVVMRQCSCHLQELVGRSSSGGLGAVRDCHMQCCINWCHFSKEWGWGAVLQPSPFLADSLISYSKLQIHLCVLKNVCLRWMWFGVYKQAWRVKKDFIRRATTGVRGVINAFAAANQHLFLLHAPATQLFSIGGSSAAQISDACKSPCNMLSSWSLKLNIFLFLTLFSVLTFWLFWATQCVAVSIIPFKHSTMFVGVYKK